MRGVACAKVNVSLEVGRLRPDGFHDLRGLFQSISWHDRLAFALADEDSITAPGGGPVPDGDANSAMRAFVAARAQAAATARVAIELQKNVPAAAGLGGGSADAAAALAAAGRMFDLETETLLQLAPMLGSDVPFCLRGGTALVSGRGDVVDGRNHAGGYAVAVVVPPVELATPVVYAEWDRLDGPAGPAVTGSALPPSLRELAPLANDLYPAAVTVAPLVDDWRDELSDRWSRPVLMTGSGPSLFAFFFDQSEAEEALESVPRGARASHAGVPVPFGWVLADDEVVLDSTGRRWGRSDSDAELRATFGLSD